MNADEVQRPPLFVIAVALHTLEALLLLLGSAIGILAVWVGCLIGLSETHRDDEQAAIFAGLLIGTFVLGLVFALGIAFLVVCYKAWSLSRGWIWALIVLAILSSWAFSPCSIFLALVTVVGGVQVLERSPD